MKKKFLALVLTLAMVLSLVPATALAANGTQEGNNQGPVEVTGSDKDNNLTMKKTVTPVQNKDGTYTVRLESYAKGEVTTTTTTKQMDIVLLLDVSGSMGDQFTQDIEEYQPVYKDSLDTSKTYLIKQGRRYKEVTYCPTCNQWTRGCRDNWWSGNHEEGKIFTPTEAESDTNNNHTQFYQYVYISGQSKMDALKTAVDQFIEGIAKNSPQSKISIVKFAGKTAERVGDDTYGTGRDKENYTQIVKELTKVGDGGANQLKYAVSQLTAAGATSSDYGLQKAGEALENATQDKVVVLFTDGEPNHFNGFDYEVATNAVNTAKDLKQDNTTIYTVGVFQNPSDDINQYMSSVSSNHPNATAQYIPGGLWENDTWTVTGGDSDFGTYYKTADSADKLIEAFQTISSQVSSTHLDANAVVVDNVPSNFALNEGSVKVYTENCIAKNDETFEWGAKTESNIRPTIDDRSISVTGFNFSKNWCGLGEDNQARGQKLIIEFTISRTNYGGTQPTNAGAYIKATADDEKEIINLNDPTVPVTISLGSNEELLEKLKVEEEKTYNGSGFAILSEVAEKANDLVDGINNAYVNMELTVTVEGTTYTYKIRAGETAGKWYEGNREMNADAVSNIKTSPNVKRGEKNAVEPYTYKFALKLSDATTGGAREANYGPYSASFTIKPAPVTVKANDQQVQKGTDPNSIPYTATVNGLVNGEQESLISRDIKCDAYTVNTAVGSELEITASGVAEQGNYTVTYRPGKLTVVAAPTGTLKVTKEVQGENLTLDKLPSDFKITVAGTGTNSTYSRELTLATQDTAEPASTTVATWTIPGLTPGTYTVSETNSDVEGYTYTAKYNDVAATQANPATVDVTAGGESTMTVTNTYTKNATVNLSDLIKKELTVKKDSELPTGTTFSVKVTPTPTGDQGTQTAITGTTTNTWENGTTDTTTGDTTYTVPFNFTSTLSLSAGTYTYTVQETQGNVSGMKYDSNTYTLTIEVKDSKATVKYATDDAEEATPVTETDPLTITNMYQTPYLSVTKQTVSVDGKEFDSNTVAHVGEQIVWAVSVTNKKTTQASTQLKDTLGDVKVYKDGQEVTLTGDTWTATVPANDTVTYYVTYTVQAKDIPNGKIVNTIVKDSDEDHPINSAPVSTWDNKQLKSATKLDTSDWTTTVKLTLPTVKQAETTVTTDNIIVNRTEVQPIIAISNGSYVIDQIGNEFTFMDELSLKVNGTELSATQDTTNKNLYRFGTETEGVYPYTVTYTAKNDETKEPAQFTWNINEDVYAGTKVTLSYKLKLTTPNTKTGTYGKDDLDGSLRIPESEALYTNESAILYKKEGNTKLAEFPKPSVSYTIKGSSGGHGGNGGGTVTIPDDVPTGLNGKDHYAYVVGYPDGMVYPQKNITRAEVATIFFRLLKDETREANMTKSNSYNDMKDGAWYTCAVSTLSKMGIIKGYEDGSFKPDASISRAEFAAIAARFDPDGDKTPATFSDVSSHWAKDEISIAANHGWIKGYEDGSFKPDQKITRAETMTLVNRVLKRLPETKDDLHKDMKTWPDNQNESAWFYLAVQEATNSHYQKLKKDGTHETWESMRETRDWAALEK